MYKRVAYLLAVIAIAIAAETPVDSVQRTCSPNSKFTDQCNKCICNSDGTAAFCTMANCAGSVVPDIESVELVCSPMTKFMDECNHCVCNSYGTAAICTTLECDLFHPDGSIKLPSEILNNPLLRSGGLEEDKKICEPSKTFKSECNTCVCSDDGLRFACTRMACTYMKRVCEPMTTFKRDCNSCSCNEDGTQAVCTRMNCGFYHKDGSIKLPSEILNNPLLRSSAPKSQVCEPTKTFYQGCNTCHCSEDGTNYSCTQMLCEPQDNKVCTPRSTFYKECNMCHCNGDGTGALCTRMSCNLFHAEGSLKLPSEILNNPLLRTRRTLNKKVCEPMTRFIKGCNSCLCNKDGTAAACTFLDCNNIIKEDGSIKLPSEILNNPLLRMGESKKVCEPMARFTKDCNNCICNKDGTAAACTFLNCNNIFHEDGSIKLPSEILNNPLLRVHHQENSDNNEWGTLYVQGAPCTPLSHFRSLCNDCVCASNGFAAACTLRACQV